VDFCADTWHLFVRLVRATLRMPIFVVFSIVQPFLWLLLFGQLFRSVTTIPGFESGSYVQFLAPGIAIMTALFGTAYAGMGLLSDIDRGVLDRMLATPASRGALIASRLAHSGSQVVVQALIIVVAASLVGARPQGGLWGLLVLLLAAPLLGSAFAGLSSALALLTRRQELIITLTNLLLLPMIYLSTMIMSRGLMPGWMRSLARFNPVDWAVVAARDGFEGRATGEMLTSLGLLVLFTALCGTVATRAFRRYLKTL
jgi:ABC-2 type transport system permease protein